MLSHPTDQPHRAAGVPAPEGSRGSGLAAGPAGFAVAPPSPSGPGPFALPTIHNLRTSLELRLNHLGRDWPWLVGVRHRGYPVIKRTHFTYPRGGGSSHRKTSLPASSKPCWAALVGAVTGLGSEAVAALILAWQFELERALYLPWPLRMRFSEVMERNPPTPANYDAFDAGRTSALARDLAAAFAHPAVSREYGAAQHLVPGMARKAVEARWYAKPIFDAQGRVAPHLLPPAGKPAALPAATPAPAVTAVPKAEAADALLRVNRLAMGAPHEPLSFDSLCELPGFGTTSGRDRDRSDDVVIRYGLITTRGDRVALQQRQGGPWRYGLYETGAPDPESAAALPRQARTHPWRTLVAGDPAAIAPWGLLVHRPVDDFPTLAIQPRPRPILLTALWHASLGRADAPLPPLDGVRWEQASCLLSGPAVFLDDADLCVLACLLRPGALPVLEVGSAQLVDFQAPAAARWRDCWGGA